MNIRIIVNCLTAGAKTRTIDMSDERKSWDFEIKLWSITIGVFIGIVIGTMASIDSNITTTNAKLTQTNAKLSSIESMMESAMKARMK